MPKQLPPEANSAVCDLCHKRMMPGAGCTITALVFTQGRQRTQYDRIPNALEDRCHDCGVDRGQQHHPGCDMERCPRCGGQWIDCDCQREGKFKAVLPAA